MVRLLVSCRRRQVDLLRGTPYRRVQCVVLVVRGDHRPLAADRSHRHCQCPSRSMMPQNRVGILRELVLPYGRSRQLRLGDRRWPSDRRLRKDVSNNRGRVLRETHRNLSSVRQVNHA